MIGISLLGVRLNFTVWFFSQLAAIFAFYDEKTALWILLFSLCHELGHITAAMLCGRCVSSVKFKAGALEMVTDGRPSKMQCKVISISGPLVNAAGVLIFAALGRKELAAYNLLLCAFNLIPIGGSDGSVVLQDCSAYVKAAVLVFCAAVVYLILIRASSVSTKAGFMFFILSVGQIFEN